MVVVMSASWHITLQYAVHLLSYSRIKSKLDLNSWAALRIFVSIKQFNSDAQILNHIQPYSTFFFIVSYNCLISLY